MQTLLPHIGAKRGNTLPWIVAPQWCCTSQKHSARPVTTVLASRIGAERCAATTMLASHIGAERCACHKPATTLPTHVGAERNTATVLASHIDLAEQRTH